MGSSDMKQGGEGGDIQSESWIHGAGSGGMSAFPDGDP